jgi:hypothetical protein
MPSLNLDLSFRHSAALVFGVLAAGPAAAAVTSAGAGGFALHDEVVFPGSPAVAWARLVAPATWWSSAHTYSGDAKNLTLATVAGGCWCETLPGGGFVRHMDVLYAAPGRALRLYGGLGPLQGMGAAGAMTFVLKPDGATTRIVVDYVVSGYVAGGFEKIAVAVDAVLGEQLASLTKP